MKNENVTVGQLNALKGAVNRILESHGLSPIEGFELDVLSDGTLGFNFSADVQPEALMSQVEKETESAFADIVANFEGFSEAKKEAKGPKLTEADKAEIEEAERFWDDFG